MTYRTIYMIEAYTLNGNLAVRRYARNKKVGERIWKKVSKKWDASMRKLDRFEHAFVMPHWVEG